jgi:hypothetical protein
MSDEIKHSPEPWQIMEPWKDNYTDVWNADGGLVLGRCWLPDARRIVGAVNACAGIPNSALESGALADALGVLAAVAEPPGTLRLKWLRASAQKALRALGRL